MSGTDTVSTAGESRSRPVAYLFALAPAGVVLVVGPALAWLVPTPAAVPTVPWPLRLAGAAVVAAGLVFAVWAVHTFARAGEPPSPVGTPDRLVTGGALAYSRNPFYLGIVAGAAGEALALESPVVAGYAAALWLVYHLLVVRHEEPALRETFGEAYDDYRDEVPRWLW